jgi:cardiolipin synthase
MFRGITRYLFGKRGKRRLFGLRITYRLRMMMVLASGRAAPHLPRLPRVRLWVDSEGFARVRKLIRRARHTVIIQMFIWKDDALGREIASLLVEAADRGVAVYVTKEAMGDIFETAGDFLTTKASVDPIWKRFWSHKRIRIRHARFDDHAKVFIIDGRVLLLTGMNIAEEYDGPWHDYMVELRGGHFVQQYLSHGEEGATTTERARLIQNTDRRKEVRQTVTELLSSAKKTVVLEQAYLGDKRVLTQLARLSHHGVIITVILPSQSDVHHYGNMRALEYLLTNGSARTTRLFLYSGMIHGKILLVDRTRAFIGSANLIASSLDRMGEVNVLLEGRMSHAVAKLREVLRQDILKSKPVHHVRIFWIQRWLAWMQL